MFTLNIDNAVTGRIIHIPSSGISNWSEISDLFATDGSSCDVAVEYDDVLYTGTLSINTTRTEVTIVFNEDVAFPGGICLQVDCGCVGCDDAESVVVAECHDNHISSVNADTRISVLDGAGCPVGYITLSQIVDFVSSSLDIPETLCDLFNGAIPHSDEVIASDRVLIVGDDDCSVSSVSMADAIDCGN